MFHINYIEKKSISTLHHNFSTQLALTNLTNPNLNPFYFTLPYEKHSSSQADFIHKLSDT